MKKSTDPIALGAKLFKPFIVKRPNGGCQILFPLSELDFLLIKLRKAMEPQKSLMKEQANKKANTALSGTEAAAGSGYAIVYQDQERRLWKDITQEDATDDELHVVHMIFGPRPDWMDRENWRQNMRACAKHIREHVARCTANTKAECRASRTLPRLVGGTIHEEIK